MFSIQIVLTYRTKIICQFLDEKIKSIINMKSSVNIVCLLLIKICSSNTEQEQDIDEIMYQDSLTAPNCRSFEFDCGNRCIDKNLVCDGKKDCPAGNDEYNDFCSIDRKNASCFYPYLPQDRYEYTLNYTSRHKIQVPEFVRGVFKCKPGYFSETVNEIVSSCIQRSWEPPIISCRKTCPQINTPKLEQTCYQQGMRKVDCNDIMWENTAVIFDCHESYHEPTFKGTVCLPNGKWSLNPDKIDCLPTCGQITRDAMLALQRKDFPWRVVVREEVNQSVRYFSGTLVDKRMVIADGASFTRSKLVSNFEILVNDEIESWGPQKSYKIKSIHFLPDRYQKFLSPDGLGSLAILEPYDEIEYGLTVSPACISPYSYPASYKIFNNTGYMVVLNDMEDLRNVSFKRRIKTFEGVCKINREKCNQYYGRLSSSNNERQPEINSINQGTGLIKYDNELKLYFLEGVYSKQHPESTNLIFTFVSDYIEWIDEMREKTKNKNITFIEKAKPKKQLKSASLLTSFHNILALLFLQFFLILIAVRFRIFSTNLKKLIGKQSIEE